MTATKQHEPAPPTQGQGQRLRDAARHAYFESERLRLFLLGLDVVTVVVFMALTFVPPSPWVIVADAVLGVVLLGEFTLRWWIANDRRAFLLRLSAALDLAVIVTLFIPTLTGNFAFLRVLRAMRLVRALKVLRQLRRRGGAFAEYGELLTSITNLLLFIFVASALVYEFQVGVNPKITNIVDAVYFTVTTLTTTGFGDITLEGDVGKLLSVVIMLAGISLFVKLAQAIFRPSKVHVECQRCGLSRHDPDAVHCKHCGAVVHIDNEGF
ncbi:MAG TPA: ion transporter [Azospirillum sp.]